MKRLLSVIGLLTGACATANDALEVPLASLGDADRGREVFRSRDGGHCVLCHAVGGVAPAGNVGPALDGVGARLSEAQIRMRIVDIPRIKPDAAMPAFHRAVGLTRVAPAYAGKPVLTGQQVEDLVAYLTTLR